MASFYSSPLLLLLLITPLSFGPAAGDPRTQDLIYSICRHCENFEFCYNTFYENIKTPMANLESLSQIAIEQSLYNATNTYIFVKKLLEDTSDMEARKNLTICDYCYYELMNLFQEAFRSFALRDFGVMVVYEKQAPAVEEKCEGIFGEDFFAINPLAERNKEMRMLITMALVAGSMLVT
ncbi:hypothetical protein NMG60_11020934 [Bertholletia excelsa]